MKLLSTKVSGLYEETTRRFPPALAVYIEFNGVVFKVTTNEAALADILKRYFGDFITTPSEPCVEITALQAPVPEVPVKLEIKKPDPGKTKIKEEFADMEDGRVVRKRLTGMLFAFGGGVHLAVGPCLDNPNQVVNFINNRYIELLLSRGCLLCHSSAVRLGRAGIGFAGSSGAGKSTLALHVLARGAHFVSNDRLMVEPRPDSLVMHGVAKLPRINPGTALSVKGLDSVMTEAERAEFSALGESELWEKEHKYDVFIDDVYGQGKFSLESPMSALAVLNWDRSGGETLVSEVDLSERTDLLRLFMKSPGLFYTPGPSAACLDHVLEDYVRILGNCRAIEFSGGVDFDAAAQKCMELLKSENKA